jgi:hypothetical protein
MLLELLIALRHDDGDHQLPHTPLVVAGWR